MAQNANHLLDSIWPPFSLLLALLRYERERERERQQALSAQTPRSYSENSSTTVTTTTTSLRTPGSRTSRRCVYAALAQSLAGRAVGRKGATATDRSDKKERKKDLKEGNQPEPKPKP